VYRCFVIPIPLDADRTVAAVEFHPGTPRVVHHASFFLDDKGLARKKDRADGRPGYTSRTPAFSLGTASPAGQAGRG
jgi:hypothetical protein